MEASVGWPRGKVAWYSPVWPSQRLIRSPSHDANWVPSGAKMTGKP
jgi:hypothetical protein